MLALGVRAFPAIRLFSPHNPGLVCTPMGAFKRGRTGTSMTVHQIPRRPCRHQWSPWRKAGIFDSTERRDCARCKRIETRKPRAKGD
jgi:hypothetical protein